MGDDNTFVTITNHEYGELLACKDKLTKLEDAGVDNWEGYDIAMRDED